MSTRPRDRALAMIEEHLVLLLASPDEQETWARGERVPAEEIAVPLWLTGLRERGSIDSADERALHRLNDLRRVQAELFVDGPSVARAPERELLRELAATALNTVRRPINGEHAQPQFGARDALRDNRVPLTAQAPVLAYSVSRTTAPDPVWVNEIAGALLAVPLLAVLNAGIRSLNSPADALIAPEHVDADDSEDSAPADMPDSELE